MTNPIFPAVTLALIAALAYKPVTASFLDEQRRQERISPTWQRLRLFLITFAATCAVLYVAYPGENEDVGRSFVQCVSAGKRSTRGTQIGGGALSVQDVSAATATAASAGDINAAMDMIISGDPEF